jgi:hypothetical protein
MTAAPDPGSLPAGETPVRRGGPPGWFILIAIGSLALGALLVVLSALGITAVGPRAEPTITPTDQAAQRTWDQVATALGEASFQVQDPVTQYRPGESPALQDVPRRLLQVILPSEPGGGYVVIYELPSNGDADRVGQEFATYLASGTGAIQYPRDTRFVLQRVGQTLVFYPWSAEVNPDPRIPELAAALQTLGVPVTP